MNLTLFDAGPRRKLTMRNMSFALTTEQIRNRTKTVTRRIGWEWLKPGDLVAAVKQVRGLKRGDKVERIGVIRIVANTAEPLSAMLGRPAECVAEGFPEYTPEEFVAMFCAKMRVDRDQVVQRIEFEHVEDLSL